MLTLDNMAETALSRQHTDSEGSVASLRMSCGRHLGPRWHCVWTQPGREHLALTELIAAEWEAFLPLCIERRRETGHRADRIVPLFSRYAFVRMDAFRDPWGAICRLPGVGGIIRHAFDRPTPLPHGAVEHMLARTSPRGVVDDPGDAPRQDIPRGANVSVLQGPLAGLQGVCSRSGPERVLVLLRLFAGTVPVSLPVSSLAVVP